MNTPILAGIFVLLILSLLLEKTERKSWNRHERRWLVRLSGFALGAAFTVLAFALFIA